MNGDPDQPPGYKSAVGNRQASKNDSAIPTAANPTKDYPVQPPVQYLPRPAAQPQGFTGVQGIRGDLLPTAQNVQIEFFKEPVKVACNDCSAYEFTRVEKKINSGGWIWVICCICAIWPLAFMVKCMDGFRVFTHHCSSCGKEIGSYAPSFGPGKLFLLILVPVIAVMVVAFAAYIQLKNMGKQSWN